MKSEDSLEKIFKDMRDTQSRGAMDLKAYNKLYERLNATANGDERTYAFSTLEKYHPVTGWFSK